jgi:SP family general alpha glucoside:H+ symporter-like MFS transporter
MQYAIPTKWQSSLFQAGQCGAFVGVLLAGPVTNRLGYRWTTLLALFMMNATIFITFFVSLISPTQTWKPAYIIQADSLEVLVIGQAFEGVPWGFFIANSPAYASEIVPLALRSACAASLQMSWAIGSIIVAGISYAYNQRNDQWSWRVPAALQWIFPVSSVLIQTQFTLTDSLRSLSWSSYSSHPSRPGGCFVVVARRRQCVLSNALATTTRLTPTRPSL